MVARELASGKAYVHTAPDKYGRPAIVIRTKKHVTGAIERALHDPVRSLCASAQTPV